MRSNASIRGMPIRFFLLTFALSFPLWLIRGKRLPFRFKLPISALAVFNPLIAAVILTSKRSGRSGVKGLLMKALDYKKIRSKIWYAPILLLNPLIMLLSYRIMRLAGRRLPVVEIPWRKAPAYFLMFFITAIGEELGWMGYAFEPIQKRWGALKASLVLGAVWAVWHLVPDLQNRRPAGWILWQRLRSFATRILTTWLYTHTGNSVFAAVLFHAMDNLSWALYPNYGSHYDPFIAGLITWLAAGIVLIVWRPETPARRRLARV